LKHYSSVGDLSPKIAWNYFPKIPSTGLKTS
jgi:hypothetical protein